MSFAPSPANCESPVPSGLELPEGQIVPGDSDSGEYILFTMEEYKTIVHIYNGYVLFDENREYVLQLQTLDSRIAEVKDQRLELCLETKNYLTTQTDDMFKVWSQEHQLRLKDQNKSAVREVLVGLGTGVAGLILGAAVGIIWASAAN